MIFFPFTCIRPAGIRVIVQPAPLRSFSDLEYLEAGAEINEDLSACGTVFGVKEIPVGLLSPERTYVYFSHTIKAQEAGMEALDAVLSRRVRLIDYEPITNDRGQRLVYFGLFAGYAGAIDTFTALGLTLIKRGLGTPFLNMVYSKHYSTLEVAKADIELCGSRIRSQGLPKEMGACVIVVTGNGNSARGAMEMCMCLGPTLVKVGDLPRLAESFDPRTVYLCQVTAADFAERLDGTAFDKEDYYARPELYRSTFEERILPYASCVLNCIYWEPRFPRLITKEGVARCFAGGRGRLAAVGDISCDIGGSIELTVSATTIDHPIFFYHPATGASHVEVPAAIRAECVAVCSIDHLPAELPRSASEFFSGQLVPFAADIAKTGLGGKLCPEVAKAVIAQEGKLTPGFEYIHALRAEKQKNLSRVCVFGAGRMVEPVLAYLCRDPKVRITVASMFMHEAETLCAGRPACRPVCLSVTDDAAGVSALIAQHNVVVSLLPATLHDFVARPCVAHGKHLVTASYIAPSLKAMHEEAVKADVIILAEMGLDPGIDHMSALLMIDEARSQGGKIIGFQSWCGGLPSPQDCDNPFGYSGKKYKKFEKNTHFFLFNVILYFFSIYSPLQVQVLLGAAWGSFRRKELCRVPGRRAAKDGPWPRSFPFLPGRVLPARVQPRGLPEPRQPQLHRGLQPPGTIAFFFFLLYKLICF